MVMTDNSTELNEFLYSRDMLLQKNSKIEVIEGAANNLPDANSLRAANKILEYVQSLTPSDIILMLVSGGGSALLPSPIPPITLEEKRFITQKLSAQGATIQELNTVRQQLSQLKGGGLARAAYPARIYSLILSDVIGDPIGLIASGPTVPSTETQLQALLILDHYNLSTQIPNSVLSVLVSKNERPETPFDHVTNIVIGSNSICLGAAKDTAESYGYQTVCLTSELACEAKLAGEFFAVLAFSICGFLQNKVEYWPEEVVKHPMADKLPLDKIDELDSLLKDARESRLPICVLAGGETTVSLGETGLHGIGGRNQELILSCAIRLDHLFQLTNLAKHFDVVVLSAGTDGIDGPTLAAGAMTYVDQVEKASEIDLQPEQHLTGHDSNSFFKLFNGGADLVVTGHTGTNVMDVQILLIKMKS